MFQNNLKTIVRGYFRNGSFTILNLLSLVIGLFVANIAFDYIRYEFSFDKFHENADKLYRLAWNYRSQDYSIVMFENGSDSSKQITQIEALKTILGVENAAQFITSEALEYIEHENKRIQEKDFLTTNTPAAFVEMFTWKLRGGSFQDFGNGSNKAILTASTAEKLFGKNGLDDPSIFSKTIKIGNENYALSAIMDDVPANSHIPFNVVLNKKKIDYWGSRIYVQVAENLDYKAVQDNINASISLINSKIKSDPLYKSHFLQAITDIHLKSNILYEMKPPGKSMYITLIGLFAVFILFITLFNYANLSLAIQSKKSKTIGVRKVLGAQNLTIFMQLALEGVLLSLIALPIAAALKSLLRPIFNNMMGTAISKSLTDSPEDPLFLLASAVLIGFMAGVTPALYLCSKKILHLFKEDIKQTQFQFFPIRKYLIVNQFVILLGITCVSYFISKQIEFIEKKNLGFQKEGIVYAYSSIDKQDLFQEKLRQLPEITSVGNGSMFGINSFNKMTYKLPDKSEVFDDAQQLYLDYEALKIYQLETSLDKSKMDANGEQPVITLINRTAAEKLAKVQGKPVDEIVGTTVITEPEYIAEDGKVGIPFTVAGIFEDINLFSLHEKIEPYFITISPKLRMDGRSIIAYNPAQTEQVLAKISSIYSELNESVPLELSFLNDNIAALHKQDSQTADLLFYFNLVAVLLAAIGIIGITLFMVVARKKEIGIRKILGASPFAIIKTTINEYVYFIGIALLISYPLAYYSINKWLSNFAYHIDIQHFVMVSIGLAAFLVTAILVGIIAFRAAQANPVESLRSE
ncbi:MAG: ABC transporter permease [Saprospiraceae bacterium]|jgi:putative ABC transport system permease protein|nr:ABC transporter permease [Saprospiraceae bacterium]